jgi:REP-associated tyrosine transposase
MNFALFDPEADYAVRWRRLPHWEQPGATYFITWRTGDSIPREVLDRWIAERDEWLRQHNINVSGRGDFSHEWRKQLARLPHVLRCKFQSEILQQWEFHLDACHGACVLRRPELARIVAGSLLHFDGDRYAMGDFVIMPNHVHLLVALPDEGQLFSQGYSWKKFTATQINRKLGQKGEFWQADGFDHLVRSQEELDHYRRYIAENPQRAGLREGEYHHYRCPHL